ncbi:MAG: quinolinate synthase NadA [Elusimicrobiota bacterium]
MNKQDKKRKVQKIKKKINAVILAHNYQPPEIQDAADYNGDSLGLSKKAASTDCDVIVFCGVDFMAETAKILSPEKKVILPVKKATCPMANMITAKQLIDFKSKYPGAPAVSYVNTTAQVKAQSDICCTSSNAVKIVKSLKENKVIFTPDKNLASYVEENVNKEIIAWDGFCYVHNSITKQDVLKAKKEYPDYVFMAHPECRGEVLEYADYAASTGQMFDIVEKEKKKNFIVGTEQGIIYPLKKRYPDRNFVPVRQNIVCRDMEKITLDDLIESMNKISPLIDIPEDIRIKAFKALDRMMKIS